MNVEFSERQQQTIATALTILAAVVILSAVGLVVWLLALFVGRFSNVFLPLAVAAIGALVFKPYMDWLRHKVRLPGVVAVIAVFVTILIPVVAFSWFFGEIVVGQLTEIVRGFPETVDKVQEWFDARIPQITEFIQRHELQDAIDGAVEGGRERIVSGLRAVGSGALTAGAGIAAWIGKLLGWVVLPVYFAFFLLSDVGRPHRLEKFLPFFKKETRDDVVYLAQQFVDIIVAFFRGQLIIAFLQGMLFAIGFSIVGLQYGFVIGLVLGFLNIIPYLGNIVGLGTALPLALFQEDGGWLRVALVLVVFAIVQMVEGYLLTPKIMGDRTGLHPMAIIVAIFFWGTALSGIMGMILAIPLTAFLVVFWRLARDKYVREIV